MKSLYSSICILRIKTSLGQQEHFQKQFIEQFFTTTLVDKTFRKKRTNYVSSSGNDI